VALRRGHPGRRLRVALWCVLAALTLVSGRLIQLQGMDGAKYRLRAEQNRLHSIPVPAMRGTITAADGTPLAITVPEDTVTADPALIPAAQRAAVAAALAVPLRAKPADLLSLLDHNASSQYLVLAKNLPAEAGNRVSALGEPGITVSTQYARNYPDGDLAANLVGFTTQDPAGDITGQAGVESAYNSLLAGRDGSEEVELGSGGQPIPVSTDKVRSLVPGSSVKLTIIPGLQWEAQQACAHQVKVTKADTCTAVVMQPGTGRILALAQYPGYQPAHVTSLAATVDLPVAAVFDPGSTAKVITAAAALENGQTPATPYNVPEQISVHGFTFHDADPHPTERLTLAGVLAHSSNVGMVQVAEGITPEQQYRYYRAFGIGAGGKGGLALPGASEGILPPPSKWWGDQRYTLSFGQGVAATAVQMASVYATIANGGVRVQPSVVAGTTAPGGQFTPAPPPRKQRVLRPATASELISILQQVPMLDATLANQPWGEIPGYSVAAKTGTAQVWDPKARCLCRYGSSYIGMAPASSTPKVVVAVNVQNPRSADYFGNYVAGPVFYHVMKFALESLKIPPDHGKRPDVPLTTP
jgi:cell division protein FtsI (penicillin-binding protein 3)